jgi:hypothetical protein
LSSSKVKDVRCGKRVQSGETWSQQCGSPEQNARMVRIT